MLKLLLRSRGEAAWEELGWPFWEAVMELATEEVVRRGMRLALESVEAMDVVEDVESVQPGTL